MAQVKRLQTAVKQRDDDTIALAAKVELAGKETDIGGLAGGFSLGR